jgi:hypothetical protein
MMFFSDRNDSHVARRRTPFSRRPWAVAPNEFVVKEFDAPTHRFATLHDRTHPRGRPGSFAGQRRRHLAYARAKIRRSAAERGT